MEYGFYHPSRGYWQSTGRLTAEDMARFPEGTVECPAQPGADYTLDPETMTWAHTPPPPSAAMVDAERDRRIAGGFVFNGVTYQSRTEDRENIAGAKSAASDALALGAEAGDLAWQQLLDPSAPAEFAWIAADNTLHTMDAQTVVQMGYAALRHKQALIFAARALKDLDPIPADFADDSYWPR